MPFCPECGAEVGTNEQFCSDCGTDLSSRGGSGHREQRGASGRQGERGRTDQRGAGGRQGERGRTDQRGAGGRQGERGRTDQRGAGGRQAEPTGGGRAGGGQYGGGAEGGRTQQGGWGQEGARSRPGAAEPGGHSQVRRRGAVDTVKWGWGVVSNRPELIGLFFAFGLLSVVSSFGIETRQVTRFGATYQTVDIAGWVYVLNAMQAVLFVVGWGVVYKTATDVIDGQRRKLGELVSATRGRILALIGTSILAGIAIGIGFVFLVLPGIYLAVKLSLSLPACVIDRTGPIESLKTSWSATSGNGGKILGIFALYILVGIVASIPLTLAGGRAGLASQNPVLTLVSQGINAAVAPVFGLAFAYVYLENRSTVQGPASYGNQPQQGQYEQPPRR